MRACGKRKTPFAAIPCLVLYGLSLLSWHSFLPASHEMSVGLVFSPQKGDAVLLNGRKVEKYIVIREVWADNDKEGKNE